MNVEEYREYCISKKGVTESFPFDEVTLVFKVMGKMFALCGLDHVPLRINLKCDPERAIALREEHDGIIEGWHMSIKHWNTVYLDKISKDLTRELIDHSYDLVVSKLTKKVKAELETM
ncbi:MmcQ/YjbR family DNA-binding protein [Maribacter litoralis]|uniref:Predicted DNA-binding protein, MmcQ/YjbR family n=1 Tax=Maribacter litoralis TaxID=2059726 RepID=A0A653SXN7_9FLAO|nr:MmcQ/YjbR family DNA-binding protein [Maribacter litoralis]VXB68931.1 Predicted DNA-binding protein, MmcQ/YjbR family [Maribacter litoralis]